RSPPRGSGPRRALSTGRGHPARCRRTPPIRAGRSACPSEWRWSWTGPWGLASCVLPFAVGHRLLVRCPLLCLQLCVRQLCCPLVEHLLGQAAADAGGVGRVAGGGHPHRKRPIGRERGGPHPELISVIPLDDLREDPDRGRAPA